MTTVKYDNCGNSVEVDDSIKKYRLPLLFIFLGIVILAYGNIASNPSIIITILGCQSATVGLIWLIATRMFSNKN